MALGSIHLFILKQVRALLSVDAPVIACLGYPDCMVTGEQVDDILGQGTQGRLTYRDDSEQIIAWHKSATLLNRVPTAESLMEQLGFKMAVYDINQSRGPEIFLDLNQPIGPSLINSVDVVFDGGTLEHCFNVGQAVSNILALAKVGGFIVHDNPAQMLNHGFYNFSPTFYYDFYIQNGHKFPTEMFLVSGDPLARTFKKVHHMKRLKIEGEGTLIVSVQKCHNRAPEWPTQSKYLRSPGLVPAS